MARRMAASCTAQERQANGYLKEMLNRTRSAAKPAILLLTLFLLVADPLFAAEGSEGGWSGLWLLIGRVMNLAVVALILVWVAKKPLANFYASRTESIREQLVEAQQARADAEAKLAEIESRMSRLDQELSEIKAASEHDARMEYARLSDMADEEARKVIDRARQEIEGMTREAYLSLKAHAADLAVDAAEKRIRNIMTDEDRNRLFSRFVSDLGDRT